MRGVAAAVGLMVLHIASATTLLMLEARRDPAQVSGAVAEALWRFSSIVVRPGVTLSMLFDWPPLPPAVAWVALMLIHVSFWSLVFWALFAGIGNYRGRRSA